MESSQARSSSTTTSIQIETKRALAVAKLHEEELDKHARLYEEELDKRARLYEEELDKRVRLPFMEHLFQGHYKIAGRTLVTDHPFELATVAFGIYSRIYIPVRHSRAPYTQEQLAWRNHISPGLKDATLGSQKVLCYAALGSWFIDKYLRTMSIRSERK